MTLPKHPLLRALLALWGLLLMLGVLLVGLVSGGLLLLVGRLFGGRPLSGWFDGTRGGTSLQRGAPGPVAGRPSSRLGDAEVIEGEAREVHRSH